MRIVVLDDENLYRKSIIAMVNRWAQDHKHEECVSVSEFRSSEDLLEAWNNGFRIDLMFLDIIIPNEIDGIQLAKAIVEKDANVQIVYITNYSDYALSGYEVNALRYLIKPVTQNKINNCLDIAWNKWMLSEDTFIRAQGNGTAFVFAAQELTYAESLGHRIVLHFSDTRDGTEINESMNAFLAKLPKQLFVRCHRGFVVNIRYVRKIKAESLSLASGTEIPVGRK